MSNVINRATLEYRTSVNTPNFPTDTWIINPDLSALTNVPTKYWKISGDLVLEMNASEKAVVDAAFTTQSGTVLQNSITNVINPDPLAGISSSVVVSGGLSLVTNVQNLITNDVTTIVPSTTGTKNVLISVVYNTVSGTFFVVPREKVAENYADLLEDEILTKDLAEFYVVASGSTLIPI